MHWQLQNAQQLLRFSHLQHWLLQTKCAAIAKPQMASASQTGISRCATFSPTSSPRSPPFRSAARCSPASSSKRERTDYEEIYQAIRSGLFPQCRTHAVSCRLDALISLPPRGIQCARNGRSGNNRGGHFAVRREKGARLRNTQPPSNSSQLHKFVLHCINGARTQGMTRVKGVRPIY